MSKAFLVRILGAIHHSPVFKIDSTGYGQCQIQQLLFKLIYTQYD